MVAKLHVVIRGRGSRAGQLEFAIFEQVQDHSLGLAHVGFQDRRLIQNNRVERFRGELVKRFIVCDGDFPGNVGLAERMDNFDAELLTLPDCLSCDGQRR